MRYPVAAAMWPEVLERGETDDEVGVLRHVAGPARAAGAQGHRRGGMEVQAQSTQERDDGLGTTILDGAVIVLVSPLVVPALLLGLRPMAKMVMKVGLCLTETVTHLATAISEGWSDVVAEARGQGR